MRLFGKNIQMNNELDCVNSQERVLYIPKVGGRV